MTPLNTGLYAAYRVDPTIIKPAFMLVKPHTVDNTKLYEPRAHTTVIFSKTPTTVWSAPRARNVLNQHFTLKAVVTKVSLFDNDNGYAIVLELNCPELLDLHRQLLNLGLTHPYNPYSPHISLGYDVTEEAAISLLDPIGRMTIGKKLELNSSYIEDLKC